MLLFYLQYNKGAGGSRQGQLTGRGGNRRLLLAALNNRDFVVWTGHFVSLLSVIGGWGGVLPPHFGQKKSRRPFSDFLLGMPLCERRIFSFESSGQVVPMCGESVKLEFIWKILLSIHQEISFVHPYETNALHFS